jgi:arabinofuranan 3-O-arabinosyltransferase
VIAAFLATPYACAYDTIVLIFAAAWIANEGSRSGFLPWEKITVLILLTLPVLSLIPAKLLHLQIAPILLWLCLAVVMRRGLGLSSPSIMPVRASTAQSAV